MPCKIVSEPETVAKRADAWTITEIRQTLAKGWPVCAGSDHSRLLVGYVDDAKQPGGGKFITRDSGLGDYGEVTYDWTRRHVYDLFWVELPGKTSEKR